MTETKAKLIATRFIERPDMERVLAIEEKAHLFADPEDQSLRIKDDRRFDTADFEEFMVKQRTRAVVLTADRKVAGYLLLDCSDEKTAVITRLTVEHRRQGMGTVLLDLAIKLATKARAEILSAYVYEEDLAAAEFFKAKGWKSKYLRRKYGNRGAFEFSTELG